MSQYLSDRSRSLNLCESSIKKGRADLHGFFCVLRVSLGDLMWKVGATTSPS